MSQPNRKIGILFVMIGAIFWGISGTVAKKLFGLYEMDVTWLVTIRMLLAGFLLLMIQLFRTKHPHIFQIWKNKKNAVQLIICGIGGMLSVQYTYLASIKHGNAAVATLLQYLAPVMIILYLVLRKQIVFSGRVASTVMLALTGCFLLLTNGSMTTLSVSSLAIVWGVLSGVALAFQTIYAVQLLKQFHSLIVVGWSMIIGGITLSFIRPPWQFNWTTFSLEGYFYLIFIIIFGTMIAFWFYFESLQSLSPDETSTLSIIEPLAAVLTTVFWLDEPFGFFQWLGSICIIGMIVLLAWSNPERTLVKNKSIKNFQL